MATITLSLIDDIPTINGKIVNSFRLHLDGVLKRSASAIRRRVGEVCDSIIRREGAYVSLMGGELLGELGVPGVASRLDAILNTIKESCEVESTPLMQAGNIITGGLVVKMVRSEFLDILALPEATYTTAQGTDIPWLNWLLLQGDKIIVMGFDIKSGLRGQERHKSRTKLAIMIPGRGWKVPSEFSGVIEDNFITRAFNASEVEALLFEIIKEEITSRL